MTLTSHAEAPLTIYYPMHQDNQRFLKDGEVMREFSVHQRVLVLIQTSTLPENSFFWVAPIKKGLPRM